MLCVSWTEWAKPDCRQPSATGSIKRWSIDVSRLYYPNRIVQVKRKGLALAEPRIVYNPPLEKKRQ